MRFILSLLFLSYAVGASAQEESLFPELAGLSSTIKEQESSEENSEVINESVEMDQVEEPLSNEEDLFQPKEDLIEAEVITDVEDVSKEEEDKEQYILWTLDDIKATLTPNRNASFCSATFAVANTLRKELKSFSGTFTVGDMTKKFDIKNLKKERGVVSKYMFVGTSCEQILNPPLLDIEKCQVDGWSEKKCKEKVKFIQTSQDKAPIE